jgi:hypothetical protein
LAAAAAAVNIVLVDQEVMLAVLVLAVTTEELEVIKLAVAVAEPIGGVLKEVAMVSSLFNTKLLKEV